MQTIDLIWFISETNALKKFHQIKIYEHIFHTETTIKIFLLITLELKNLEN